MEKKQFIYTFDLLGKNPTLFAFGNERKKSLFGSIMSLILMIIIFLIIYLFIKEWLKGTNLSVNFSLYTINENTSIPFNLTKMAFTTNFKIEKEFNLTFYYKNEIEEITILNFTVCNPNQDENKKVLYCFNNLEQNMINFNNVFEGIIVFYSEIIVNVTSNLNFNEEKMNEFILNPPTITFFFDNLSYQNFNRKNPIQKIGIQFSATFPLLYTTIYNYSLIFSDYLTDDGYIFSDKKVYHNVILNQKPFITSNLRQNNSNYLGYMSLSLSPYNAEKYIRKFVKLHEILSQFGGIISLLKIFFEEIVEICSKKFFYYNLMLEVLKIEKNCFKEIKLKNENIFRDNLNNNSNNNNLNKVNYKQNILESFNDISKLNIFNNVQINISKLELFDYFCRFICNKNLKVNIKKCNDFCKKHLSCENIISKNYFVENLIQNNLIIEKNQYLFKGSIPNERVDFLILKNK